MEKRNAFNQAEEGVLRYENKTQASLNKIPRHDVSIPLQENGMQEAKWLLWMEHLCPLQNLYIEIVILKGVVFRSWDLWGMTWL